MGSIQDDYTGCTHKQDSCDFLPVFWLPVGILKKMYVHFCSSCLQIFSKFNLCVLMFCCCCKTHRSQTKLTWNFGLLKKNSAAQYRYDTQIHCWHSYVKANGQ